MRINMKNVRICIDRIAISNEKKKKYFDDFMTIESNSIALDFNICIN